MSFSGPNSISSLCESRSAFGLYVQPIVVYGWFEQSNFLRSFSFIFRSSIQTEQGMPASYSLEALLESMIASIPRYNCFGNLGLIYLRFLIGTRRSDNYIFFFPPENQKQNQLNFLMKMHATLNYTPPKSNYCSHFYIKPNLNIKYTIYSSLSKGSCITDKEVRKNIVELGNHS